MKLLSNQLLLGSLVFLMGAAVRGDEPPRRSPAFVSNARKFAVAVDKLTWVAYTPTEFRPDVREKVSNESIEADLRALIRHGFDPAKTGICTYGCDPAFGLDRVGHVAKRLGFAAHLLGVWSIKPEDRELETAVELAEAGACVAINVGNEGLDVRYDWKQLSKAMGELRQATNLPVSTAEQIFDYGRRELTDPSAVDFVHPIIHPVLLGHSTDPADGVRYVDDIVAELRKKTQLNLLVRETGWPSQGLPPHSLANQKRFWELMLSQADKSGYSVAIFESFSLSWKHENFGGADIGTSWGWFHTDRTPKPVVELFSKRK